MFDFLAYLAVFAVFGCGWLWNYGTKQKARACFFEQRVKEEEDKFIKLIETYRKGDRELRERFANQEQCLKSQVIEARDCIPDRFLPLRSGNFIIQTVDEKGKVVFAEQIRLIVD